MRPLLTLYAAAAIGKIAPIVSEKADFLKRFSPYEEGVAPEQMIRRRFRALDSRGFQEGFAAWISGLAGTRRGVIAIDGNLDVLKGFRHCRETDLTPGGEC